MLQPSWEDCMQLINVAPCGTSTGTEYLLRLVPPTYSSWSLERELFFICKNCGSTKKYPEDMIGPLDWTDIGDSIWCFSSV